MTKEEFIKELTKNLKYLNKKERNEELVYYENMENYNINPIKIANDIYKRRGINITITKNIKFLDALNIIISNLESKDKKKLKNILLFFLWMLILIIIIKIPFIYIRDIIANIFIDTFKSDKVYALWVIILELIYALTAIIIFIKKIKVKALELEKEE